MKWADSNLLISTCPKFSGLQETDVRLSSSTWFSSLLLSASLVHVQHWGLKHPSNGSKNCSLALDSTGRTFSSWTDLSFSFCFNARWSFRRKSLRSSTGGKKPRDEDVEERRMFVKTPQSWFQRLKAAASAQRQRERRWRQERLNGNKNGKNQTTNWARMNKPADKKRMKGRFGKKAVRSSATGAFREYPNYWKRTLTKQSSGDGKERHMCDWRRKKEFRVSSEVLRKLGHKNSRWRSWQSNKRTDKVNKCAGRWVMHLTDWPPTLHHLLQPLLPPASNPFIHPSSLYTLWGDNHRGKNKVVFSFVVLATWCCCAGFIRKMLSCCFDTTAKRKVI